MADIVSYLSQFFPARFDFLLYVFAGSLGLIAIDCIFGLVSSLFGKIFK